MEQRDILDIVEDLRNCGVEKVEIEDLSVSVNMTIRGFVLAFAKQKDKWLIEKNEKFESVSVAYCDKAVTYKMYVGTCMKMQEIADYVGLEYGK